jgi:hypothetical protein
MMKQAESIFWGLAMVAGIYLLSGYILSSANRVNAQIAKAGTTVQAQTQAQTLPSGAHTCGGGGGGCGCGSHGQINNPQ